MHNVLSTPRGVVHRGVDRVTGYWYSGIRNEEEHPFYTEERDFPQMDAPETHHPACRVEVERWLEENHAAYKFELRALGDFNVEESLRNQARIGQSLNRETSNDYKIAMERGDTFPALIAYWKSKKLVIIDGNHRLDGHIQVGTQKVPTYIVDASPEIIVGLTYSANVRNGLPTSHEERMVQAVHLLDMDSSVKDAAEKLGLSEGQVKTAWNRTAADRRASTIGIRGWNKIAATAKERLGNIRTDEGMKAAAELVSITPMTVKEISDLVGEINKSRSATGQIDFVEKKRVEFGRRIQSTAGNTVKRPNLTAFARFMGSLAVIDGFDVQEVARTANMTTDVQTFNDACMNTADRLMQIAEAVERQILMEAKRANGKR